MFTLATRSFPLHTSVAVAGVGALLTTVLGGGLANPASASTDTPGTASGLVTTTGTDDFDAFLAALVQDTGTYWSGQLAAWAPTYGTAPWQTVSYAIIDSGSSMTSQCTNNAGQNEVAGDPDELPGADPAFFCGTDMTVYLSSSWLYDHVWSASDSTAASDFGVAYAIAHEMGHAVQHDLGITAPAGSPTVAPTELQADCLAGVWSNAKYYANVLEADDIDQAVAAATAVGDYEFSDPGHHGTPEQRSAAFMLGYNGGDAGGCTLDLADTL